MYFKDTKRQAAFYWQKWRNCHAGYDRMVIPDAIDSFSVLNNDNRKVVVCFIC